MTNRKILSFITQLRRQQTASPGSREWVWPAGSDGGRLTAPQWPHTPARFASSQLRGVVYRRVSCSVCGVYSVKGLCPGDPGPPSHPDPHTAVSCDRNLNAQVPALPVQLLYARLIVSGGCARGSFDPVGHRYLFVGLVSYFSHQILTGCKR
ncbi:hypothetical protein NDU88_001086 [Pleurodeles waltl]|uniref:Uncharacterized protein n=1 Tax=Pleurodeles waltl TaxID=8319 RepID=A0AAV7RAL9_PLEWA|nr:hypothetical protein NDU88_001086 [Pleurodeles waltl]